MVDASQELLAIGLCNIGNSMVQSYPGTGSLSRSAVSNSSGVRTPMGSLYTGKFPNSHQIILKISAISHSYLHFLDISGILVVLALLFFTPCFTYIPRASLAAVIIAAVVFMVEVRVVKPIYRSKSKHLF